MGHSNLQIVLFILSSLAINTVFTQRMQINVTTVSLLVLFCQLYIQYKSEQTLTYYLDVMKMHFVYNYYLRLCTFTITVSTLNSWHDAHVSSDSGRAGLKGRHTIYELI
jgi:hypothetical protein